MSWPLTNWSRRATITVVDEPKSGALSSLRETNKARVVAAVRRHGVSSRARVSRETGLSRTTVSSLVAQLLAEGVLLERPDDTPAVGPQGGRPAVLLTLHPTAGTVIGVDFGHTHLRVAVADLSHEILAEEAESFDTDSRATDGLDLAAAMVDRALTHTGFGRDSVIAVGLGVPGPVTSATGTVGSSSILAGWAGIRPAVELARRLGVPVQADNDANLGAIAETVWGAGRGCRDVAYLKVSSGIGAGFVLDGRLFRGSGGLAGEIGHWAMDQGGLICRCGGRGCLETIAGADAIVRLLAPTHGADLTLRDVVAGARDGDIGCRRAVTDAGEAIGTAVAQLCNLLNPERVVIGGELAAAGHMLTDAVRSTVDRQAVVDVAEQAVVVAGELGDRAEVLGAVALGLFEPGTTIGGQTPAAAPVTSGRAS